MNAGSKLEAALVANAIKLSKNAAASLPHVWNLVQVEFAATNFSTFSAAAAPSMHRFLRQSAGLHAQPEQLSANMRVHLPRVADGANAAAVSASAPRNKMRVSHSTELCSRGHARASAMACLAADYTLEHQQARMQTDNAGCPAEPAAFADVDIEQQRQMLRDIAVRQALSRQQPSNQAGLKRTHTGQGSKQAGKQSKLVHDTGQRTITSLFRKD